MNIFFLSFDPIEAAKWHCDKHVVKMILESTQLLWTAHHILVVGEEKLKETDWGVRPYAQTHKNHPCAVWVRESFANYMWLCDLADALVEEYHWRFPPPPVGKGKEMHVCEPHLEWLRAHPPFHFKSHLWNYRLTLPAQAMPDKYKNEIITEAYRTYYRESKKSLLQFTRRESPEWL